MYQSPLEPKGYEKLSDVQKQQIRRSRQALAVELILVVVAMLLFLVAVVGVLKQKQSDERYYFQRAGLIVLEAHPGPIRKGVNVNGTSSTSVNWCRR